MSRWPASYHDRLGTPSSEPYLIQESTSEFPKAFEFRFTTPVDEPSDPMGNVAFLPKFCLEAEPESVTSQYGPPQLANWERLNDNVSHVAPVFGVNWDRSEGKGVGASLLRIVNVWSRVIGLS
jgi:hypothetical protein